MRASLTIFALIVSTAVGAFAGVVERDHLVKRGGPVSCTYGLDGTGGTDVQVTKDCCAAVDYEAYFNEAEKQCQPYSLFDSVDTVMVECCTSRGRGSRAV